jgi:hypothetical protein
MAFQNGVVRLPDLLGDRFNVPDLHLLFNAIANRGCFQPLQELCRVLANLLELNELRASATRFLPPPLKF